MNPRLIDLVLEVAEEQGWNRLVVNLSATDQEEVFHFTVSDQRPNTIVFILNRDVRKLRNLKNRSEWTWEVWKTLDRY